MTDAEKRERARRWHIAWREKNRAHLRAWTRQWRKARPDIARKAAKKWTAKNRERAARNVAAWRASHRTVIHAHNAKYRAQRRGATPPLSVFEQAAVFGVYAVARARTVQTGVRYHVDHIIPLSKGGLHHPANLQVLTAAENLAKGDRVYLN